MLNETEIETIFISELKLFEIRKNVYHMKRIFSPCGLMGAISWHRMSQNLEMTLLWTVINSLLINSWVTDRVWFYLQRSSICSTLSIKKRQNIAITSCHDRWRFYIRARGLSALNHEKRYPRSPKSGRSRPLPTPQDWRLCTYKAKRKMNANNARL